MIDPDKTRILLGPPGCGKTYNLLDIMESEMRAGVDPHRVGFVAFTKKAATVAKDRAMSKFKFAEADLPFFRTLHSLAFRQLGTTRDQMLQWSHYRELGEKLGMSLRTHKNVEDGTTYGMTSEERMMFLEGLSRIKREDLRKTWIDSDEEEVSWWELERYSRALKEYKLSRMVLDFTDLIDQFLEQDATPALDVLLVDEAQDLSESQWRMVEKLALKAKRTYVSGDDDQCSVQGSLVATTVGPIKVEDLDPKIHRLLSWRRDTHCVHGTNTGGFAFEIEHREYSGQIVRLEAVGKNTRCTPDHLWFVRFKRKVQENPDFRAVYIMKKGDWFRVGECQIFGPKRQMHLAVRARKEKADGLWILGVFKSKKDSRTYENIVAYKYGLPQLIFEPTAYRTALDDEATRKIFNSLSTKDAAEHCLDEHGLDIDFPFFTPARAHSKSGGTPIFELEAGNILSDLMEIPLPSTHKDEWASVETTRENYSGLVFALNVVPHHTYIVDGLVTKNCIYKWAGADVQQFIDLKGDVKVLDQSYRIPSSVHSVAESISKQISNRRPKKYKPRSAVGEVKWYGDPEEVDLSQGTWLLLARNGYLLTALEEMCVRDGFSFESVSHSPLQSESLKAIKSWESLRRGGAIPIEEAMLVARFMTPGKGVRRETKELLKKADRESFVTLLELAATYGFRARAVWFEALEKIPDAERDYFRAARKRGETLTRKPRIMISTIHAAKGGEAEHVLLLTDMSYRTFSEMQKNPDNEHRTWYVSVTRCSEMLHIIAPRTNLCYEFC